ncbi:MAG TPA: phospholipase D-like domain-containing protein [Oscillatoriaceae cyanobacterium]
MFQANLPVALPKSVGNYGRFATSSAPNAAIAPLGPAPLGLTGAPAASLQPASKPGFFASLIAWLERLFAPSAPQPSPLPVPQPVPPPAPPVTPAPAPTPSSGPGAIQAYFTDTYLGTNSGLSSADVRARNQASAQADPNNPDQRLVQLIDSVPAGGTLDGAFFDIEVPDVVNALCQAAQRGVQVRMVTENDYYHAPNSTAVRAPIAQLQSAGVQVLPDDRSGLMHDKFLVANGQTVWTGSYNITDGGTYGDNNDAVQIQSPQLAAIYEQEFQKMFAGNFGDATAASAHPAPQTVDVGGAQVTAYFSPNSSDSQGPKAAIMQALAGAQKSIKFMGYSYTDKDMGNLMLQKAQSGVDVQGVFEKDEAGSSYSQYHALKNAGLDVREDTNPALMHHKVIIVDDSTLILGSFNFSSSAQHSNDENMLVIKNDPQLVAAYEAEYARMQQLSA